MAKKKYPISLKEVEAEYQELSARMNYGGSRYLPRIIKKALTLEQARITLEFYNSNEDIGKILAISADEVAKDPTKYQVEAICKKLKLDKKTVEDHIQYMFEVGFIFPTRRGWRFARNMMQLKDSMTNPKYDEQLGDDLAGSKQRVVFDALGDRDHRRQWAELGACALERAADILRGNRGYGEVKGSHCA